MTVWSCRAGIQTILFAMALPPFFVHCERFAFCSFTLNSSKPLYEKVSKKSRKWKQNMVSCCLKLVKSKRVKFLACLRKQESSIFNEFLDFWIPVFTEWRLFARLARLAFGKARNPPTSWKCSKPFIDMQLKTRRPFCWRKIEEKKGAVLGHCNTEDICLL